MNINNTKLTVLKKLNPSLEIESVFSSSFNEYGKILNLNCRDKLLKKLDSETQIPNKGNIYTPFVRNWEDKETVDEIFPYFNEKIEIGYCNGQNTSLNALEWHCCDEINIYATDAILFLAKLTDFDKEQKIDSSKVKTFFVPKNTAILLLKSTLHFSPCKVDQGGFKAIIILSNLTNTELKNTTILGNEKYKEFLFKKNKYIICHKDFSTLTVQNVKANLVGKNLNLKIL